jgi:hypothetical protein
MGWCSRNGNLFDNNSIRSTFYEKEMNWISVKDGLPEMNQKVIICQKKKRHIGFAEYNGERFESPGFTTDGIHIRVAYWADVIFWMPLPEPPKE